MTYVNRIYKMNVLKWWWCTHINKYKYLLHHITWSQANVFACVCV